MDALIRDGYVVIRGAFDADTASACRAVIWDVDGRAGSPRGRSCDLAAAVELDGLAGGSFTAAGSSPALTAACGELIGPGRWCSPVNPGGAVVVRFPSEDWANAGYHIEGSLHWVRT